MIPRLSKASPQPFKGDLEPAGAGGRQPSDSFPAPAFNNNYAIPLVIGLGGWQLHRAGECLLARRLAGIEIGLSARYWLQSFRQDTFAMTAMRKVLLAEGSTLLLTRLREEDAIEQVAHFLKSGRWHVCEPVMRVYPVTAKEPAPAAFIPFPRRAPRPSEPAPVREVAETPTLAGNADQAAIAAVLKLAASTGVPFCEECAKMASR